MEAMCSSKWTSWHYIPEDETLHNPCCENLKSYMIILNDKNIYRLEQWKVSEVWNKSDSQSVVLKIIKKLKLCYFISNKIKYKYEKDEETKHTYTYT
jgi:hypothetical protein